VDTIQRKSYYRKNGRPHNTLFHATNIVYQFRVRPLSKLSL
jgi:hypothetical protein